MAATSATSPAAATSGVTSFDFLNTGNPVPGHAYTADEQNQRFLKLLTTQLQNQDPLNPMDNSQMTTQIAQISTVSGLEKLYSSIGGLTGQFLQMQALQGASMVGRQVAVSGDGLSVDAQQVGHGRFSLAAPADAVTVEVLAPSGQVVASRQLGAASSGAHGFEVDGSALDPNMSYRFRVQASNGGKQLTAQTQTQGKVDAVRTEGNQLLLELEGGRTVPYDEVKALL